MSVKEKKQSRACLWISLFGILCAVCLMVVFLITSIEAVVYWTPGYFEAEYTKHQVLNNLPPMTMADLLEVTEEMMAYLRGNRADLHVFTTIGGQNMEFFNTREIAHMEDVRDLFIGGLWLRRIGLAFTAVYALSLAIWSKGNASRKSLIKTSVPGALCLGTGLFFAAAIVIAGIVASDFSKYFIVFHHIFFDNDLWILNPATDLLINIVPEPFFMDTALRIGITFAVMVLSFLGISFFLWKRGKRTKLLCILLCACLILGNLPTDTAYATESWPTNVSIEADGGILIDADSGTVLFEKNVHNHYYPASITKILTALIVIKHCDLDDTVTFTHSAVNTLEPGSSILGARVGDKMNVRDCLYALLLQSANEVANALAEHCSGSVEAFAELMNQEAQALGCVDSNFANPSGLNNENHYTSAHDMALIAQAAFSDPTFLEIDKTLYYDVPAGQLQQYPDGWRYYMHHRMMKKNDSNYYSGIIGGKTGYTSLAGNTLVTCAERDGLKLIAVVLNGHQTHYSDTKALLDFGFENFKSVLIADEDSTYQNIEQDLSIGGIVSGDMIKLTVDSSSSITLPVNGQFTDVTSTLDYNLDNLAPETAVARIDYMYGSRIVGQAYLEAITVPGYELKEAVLTSNTESVDAAVTDVDDTVSEETFPMLTTSAAHSSKTQDSSDEKEAWNFLPILKKILMIGAVIGVVGALIFAIAIYREKQEERAMIIRRQNRERRRKEWGSSTEFNLVMQEHLRSKNRFKKKGFFEQLLDLFRRK